MFWGAVCPSPHHRVLSLEVVPFALRPAVSALSRGVLPLHVVGLAFPRPWSVVSLPCSPPPLLPPLPRPLSQNAMKKKVKPPYSNVDMLFPAATSGWLIARAEDKVALFETQSRRVLNEIQVRVCAPWVGWGRGL